jgi:hypothetical protein
MGWDLGFGIGMGLGFRIGMGMGFGIWDGMGWDGTSISFIWAASIGGPTQMLHRLIIDRQNCHSVTHINWLHK